MMIEALDNFGIYAPLHLRGSYAKFTGLQKKLLDLIQYPLGTKPLLRSTI